MKRPLVFTNGCFDVLHRGHVELLREASLMGETLVVAVNNDASVRALKGEGRPVNTLADRMVVLLALRFVGEVLVFGGEHELGELIWNLKPEVYVKGADWRGHALNPHGRMVFIPHRYLLSTTGIITSLAAVGK